jgi:hypothetical protein
VWLLWLPQYTDEAAWSCRRVPLRYKHQRCPAATLPPTSKTTQCTWMLADRIAMEALPCSMATTDALSRELSDTLAPCTVTPQIPKSYCCHSVTPRAMMHALPGHDVRHHVLLVMSTEAPASHGCNIIRLEHSGQLLMPVKPSMYTYTQVCGCRLPWRHKLFTSIPYKQTSR